MLLMMLAGMQIGSDPAAIPIPFGGLWAEPPNVNAPSQLLTERYTPPAANTRSPFRSVWDDLGPLKPLPHYPFTIVTSKGEFIYHVGWIGGQ